MEQVLALDLGGSKLALAQVRRDGTLTTHTRLPTADISGGDDLVAWLAREVRGWGIEPEAIGISSGGPLDDEAGVITRWPRMEMLWGYPLAAAIRRAVPTIREVKLVNDACAACAGEVLFGAAGGLKRVLYLTISTGVGGGAIMGGILLRGDKGNVAEFGHTCVAPAGPRCDCGALGCIEAVMAASGLYHRLVAAGLYEAQERGWAELGFWLKDRLAEGHPEVTALWEEGLSGLAIGIVSLWNSFVPQAFVIGGGLSSLVQADQDKLWRFLEQRAHLMPMPRDIIRWSENRHTIPLLGAAGVAAGWIPHEAL